MSRRLLLVSGDGHTTPPMDEIVMYLEEPARSRVDELIRENTTYVNVAATPTRPSPSTLEQFDERNLVRGGGEYGACNPTIRLEQMDAEGIAAEIVHDRTQTNVMPFYGQGEVAPAVRWAGARAYHRWLSDFAAKCDDRIFGVAEPGPCHDMDATVDELEWLAANGFVAVSAPGFTPDPELPFLYDAHFEPFWETCAGVGLVISVHAGWGGPGLAELKQMMGAMDFSQFSDEDGGLNFDKIDAQMNAKGSPRRLGLLQPRRVMWQLMAGGVLDRHPSLKVALTEVRADWVPATIAHLEQRFASEQVQCELSPREYWERNFLVVPSSIHKSEVEMRDEIGVRQLGFGQDFPHWEGVWPNTMAWLQDAFGAIGEDDLRAIAGENVAAFYGLPVERLRDVADRIGPEVGDVLGDHHVDQALIDYFHKRSGYLRAADPVYGDEIDSLLLPDLAGLAAGVR